MGFQTLLIFTSFIYFLFGYFQDPSTTTLHSPANKANIRQNLSSLKKLILNKQNQVYFFGFALFGVAYVVQNKFLFLYLYRELQAKQFLFGILIWVGKVAEIMVLLKSKVIIESFGLFIILLSSILLKAL